MDYVNLTRPRQQVLDVDALNEWKQKVTNEFFDLLCKVKKGYKVDYEYLLEEISFINLMDEGKLDDDLSLTILQFYINGENNPKGSIG